MAVISLFETKPTTIHVGQKIKGKYPVFVYLDVQDYNTGDVEEVSYKYQAISERVVLTELTVDNLLAKLADTFLVLATDDELVSILSAFGGANNLDAWHKVRRAQIKAYDASTHVNSFTLHGVSGWLDKNTRVGLVNMYQLYQQTGNVDDLPALWVNGQPVEFDTADEALVVLGEIEMYAAKCYAITQRLLTSIDNMAQLQDIGGLQQLEYRSCYPPNLSI